MASCCRALWTWFPTNAPRWHACWDMPVFWRTGSMLELHGPTNFWLFSNFQWSLHAVSWWPVDRYGASALHCCVGSNKTDSCQRYFCTIARSCSLLYFFFLDYCYSSLLCSNKWYCTSVIVCRLCRASTAGVCGCLSLCWSATFCLLLVRWACWTACATVLLPCA